MAEHEVVTKITGGNATTVGLSYENKNGLVTGVLVGGPAFRTQKIHKGDQITAIDGIATKGNMHKISEMLTGCDAPNSTCELTVVSHTTGLTGTVSLQRMPVERIADNRKMFELLTKVSKRLSEDEDAEGVTFLDECLELWTAMVVEEHAQDLQCASNIAKMQQECHEWLDELHTQLEAKASHSAATTGQATHASQSALQHIATYCNTLQHAATSHASQSAPGLPIVLKLGMDFKAAGEENSAQRAKFEQDLRADLASAAAVHVDMFTIKSLSPGSIVVNAEIVANPAGTGPDPLTVATMLAAQADDPSSLLRKGKLTGALQGVAVPLLQLDEHAELKRLRTEQAASSSKQDAVAQAHDLLSKMKLQLEDSHAEKMAGKKLADQEVAILVAQLQDATQQVVKHCNTLQHTATHNAIRCDALQDATQQVVAHCNTLQQPATRGNTLQHTATLCNIMQHTAMHCNALQHTATHCHALQHAATHCNTLQHTATHCNTLQVDTQLEVAHCNTL